MVLFPLQIKSSVSFNINHSAFPEVFTTYATLLADSKLGLHLKVSVKHMNFQITFFIIFPFYTFAYICFLFL